MSKDVVGAVIIPLRGRFAHDAFGEAERARGERHRSDLVVPFGAWRGSPGVDGPRARRLFTGLPLG